jgi:hypothetical protein
MPANRKVQVHVLKIPGGSLTLLQMGLKTHAQGFDSLQTWNNQMEPLTKHAGLHGPQTQQNATLTNGHHNKKRTEQGTGQQNSKQAKCIQRIANALRISTLQRWSRLRSGNRHVKTVASDRISLKNPGHTTHRGTWIKECDRMHNQKYLMAHVLPA